MNAEKHELTDLMVQIERQRLGEVVVKPATEPQTVHYTLLPEDVADDPIARNWNYYRREVSRLLAEGHEGKWVIIKGEKIVGICKTEEEAKSQAVKDYLMMPVLIHQVLVREPVLRTPTFK